MGRPEADIKGGCGGAAATPRKWGGSGGGRGCAPPALPSFVFSYRRDNTHEKYPKDTMFGRPGINGFINC